MVAIPTKRVFVRLNSNTPHHHFANASATVYPKIKPLGSSDAKKGKVTKRFANNATPVAIKQLAKREIITVLRFFLY